MVLTASSPTASRLLHALRFGALGLVCLLVAHDAIFAAQAGFGAAFARAMSAGGHDGYWSAFTTAVVLAGTLLGLWAAIRLARLRGAIGRGPGDPLGGPVASYRRELVRLWSRLLPLTAVAFAVQENIEHVLGHGHVLGLGALAGPEYPLAVPVIAAVTLLAAAVGALVRWRILVLEARLSGHLHRPRERGLGAVPVPSHWAGVAAIRARAWFLVRLDAGRAPPRPA